MGGKFDKSFNEAAYNGAEKFKNETGHRLSRVRGHQRDPARAGAAQHGAAGGTAIVVGFGFSQATAGEGRPRSSPNLKFVIIDSVVDLPNVQSVVFKEHEGIVPGRHGGGDGVQDRQGRLRRRHGHPADPQLRARLRAGREVRQPEDRGVPEHDRHDAGRLERPDARRRARAGASSTRAPTWSTPRPGATGLGVLQAAKDKGKLAIGVDSNQNHLHPGSVLTSMMKRVDVAVLRTLQDREGRHLEAGRAQPGPGGGRRRLRASTRTTAC